MERRWKRNVVSRVSSVIVVIRLPLLLCELNDHLMPCTSCFYGKWVKDVCTGIILLLYTSVSYFVQLSFVKSCFYSAFLFLLPF